MKFDDDKEKTFSKKNGKSISDLENYLYDHINRSSQPMTVINSGNKLGQKKTILLIDDDEDMREIGRKIIQSAGYNFLSATNGNEGLDFILQHKPDLILLDFMMPGMTGAEVFQRLIGSQRYKHLATTPVIMLTAKSEYEVDRSALFEMGLSAFLINTICLSSLY